jgi:hypothetical protein
MEMPAKIIFHPNKCIIAAILMPLFLGPIGLLYSSFLGAIIMLLLMLGCIPLGQKGGSVALLLWVVGIFWSVLSANRYNKKMLKRYCPSQQN